MKKYIQFIFILLIACKTLAWAGDIEDGDAAYANKDYVTALKKYIAGGTQSDPDVQLKIGLIFVSGEGGVGRDFVQAMHWYKLAAVQGNAEAQLRLSWLYERGLGAIQDHAAAINWLKISASQGYSKSQNFLAREYEYGGSLKKDKRRAYMWYSLAAIKGENSSYEIDRDQMGKKMTAQQITEAQKMALDCQARKLISCD